MSCRKESVLAWVCNAQTLPQKCAGTRTGSRPHRSLLPPAEHPRKQSPPPRRRSIPPLDRPKFHGLLVFPFNELSVSYAIKNSGVFVFPKIIAPAARNRATQRRIHERHIRLPHQRSRRRRPSRHIDTTFNRQRHAMKWLRRGPPRITAVFSAARAFLRAPPHPGAQTHSASAASPPPVRDAPPLPRQAKLFSPEPPQQSPQLVPK